MFKTGPILANSAFFVKHFSEKSQKNANYREKSPKMFKTDFILANVAFFVKVSSRKKRCCYRSAGACPPRSLKQNEKRPSLRGHGRFLRHPRHGEGQALALRVAARFPPPSRDANWLNQDKPIVVWARLSPNGSRSGDLDLQR